MKQALIVKLGAIGDVIMAVPAARALHERGYSIDWICGPSVAGLLRCYSWMTVIVADDAALLHGSLSARVKALTGLWRTLGGRRYDLVATLYYDRRLDLLTLPVRALTRISLDRKERGRAILPGRSHAAEFMRIVLGLPDDRRDSPVPLCRPDTLPASILPAPTRRRIALIPGGASNMVRQQTLRRWPVERYAEVATALLQRGDEVVLLGGPTDTWVRDTFAHLSGRANLLDRIGMTSLAEMISTCDSCDLVLSHDTGPLHLAGMSLSPVLALFGPTEPGSFLPRRPGVQYIHGGEGMACRPCYNGSDFAACQSNGCMQSISVEDVLSAVDSLLADAQVDVVVLESR